MQRVLHLMNPAAGKGVLPDKNSLSGEVYTTQKPSDAVEYLKKTVTTDDDYLIYVYGGDGTLNEAANGIMNACHDARITLVPVPTGSGNDFHRVTGALTDISACDIIKYGDKYAINEINIGFDTGVAERTNKLKKNRLVGGSFAYILGVLIEFIRKHPTEMTVRVTGEDGTVEEFSGEFLLCIAANGRYYGGGFMAAPTAELSDGLLDLVLVRDISRVRFATLVSSYKNGTHIDRERNAPTKGFEDIMIFRRAKKLEFDGIGKYSADGEIFDANGSLTVECIPSVISVCSENARLPVLK